MPGWRTYLALVALLALLVPAAAVAQNPGDQQYHDPLAPNQQDGGGQSGGGGGGAGDTAPPGGSGAQAGAPQAGEQPAAAPEGSARELPRSGLPAGVMALLGGGMLAAGAALRRRLS